MDATFQIDLLISKINVTKDFSIDFFESNFTPLTPGSKYQAELITATIIINSLKHIGAFQRIAFNTNLFLERYSQILLLSFEKYKQEHKVTTNTYKHRSAVIEHRLNLENRNFFKKTSDELKHDMYLQFRSYVSDIESFGKFYNLYINLFCFPNFNANLSQSEQQSERNKYVDLIMQRDIEEFQKFREKMENLINFIRTKLNEDSYFMTVFSSSTSTSSSNKNCYIATMVYEDIEHPKVVLLRKYRDEIFVNYFLGRFFIKVYYIVSPHLVKRLKNSDIIKNGIRIILDKWLNKCNCR